MFRSRWFLAAMLAALCVRSAGAAPKRVELSEYFFLEERTRLLDPYLNYKFFVRTSSGSSECLASWWGANVGPHEAALSRDGRSAVYCRDGKGIFRYVVGQGEILLHDEKNLGGQPGPRGDFVGDFVPFVYKERSRNARGTPWVVNGEGEEMPLVLVGGTPLHVAAFEGRLGAIDSLLQTGVDPDTLSPQGFSPLGIASLVGQREALLRMLDKKPGALNDGLVRNATVTGRWDIVEALLVRGGSPDAGLRSILEGGRQKPSGLPDDSLPTFVRRLLNHGADPNADGRDGRRPLDMVTDDWLGPQWAEAGRILIEGGADPNLRGQCQNTPLISYAIYSGHGVPDKLQDLPAWERSPYYAFLEALVAHTRDLDAVNCAGTTAISGAIPDALPVARYLIAHGASDTVKIRGRTAHEIIAHEPTGPKLRWKGWMSEKK
jgi:ankyrin repeat protein